MKTLIPYSLAVGLIAICAPGSVSAQPAYLDAPIVRNVIHLTWNTTSKEFRWTADDNAKGAIPKALASDPLFVPRSSILIPWPQLNPLRLQASFSVKAADAPAAATMGQLISALRAVGS